MSKVDNYAQGTPSYVELTTPDQQAAKGFYGPLLGWEFEDIDMGEAGVYVAVSVQGDSIAGIAGQMPQLAGHPAFWGVYLAVDDVDATAAKVVPAGGKVEAGPFDVMQLGRMASIQDPTGVRVNLWQAGQSIGSVRVNEPNCPIWHELSSPDLPVATKFYSDVLGVEWESMPMETGDDYTCLMVDGRPAGRRRLPAPAGRHPAALGRLLQCRGLRRDRRPGGAARRRRAGPADRPAGRRPGCGGPRPSGRAGGVPAEPAGGRELANRNDRRAGCGRPSGQPATWSGAGGVGAGCLLTASRGVAGQGVAGPAVSQQRRQR